MVLTGDFIPAGTVLVTPDLEDFSIKMARGFVHVHLTHYEFQFDTPPALGLAIETGLMQSAHQRVMGPPSR